MDIVKYVSFEQAFESIPVGKLKLQANAYLVSGQFPVVDQGQSQISGYTNDENLVIKNCLPFIVFGDHTRAVKFVDFPFVVGADGVRLFQAKKGFESEFLYFFLKNAPIPNDGYGRHSKHLENLEVPLCLPKLQSTIVARLKSQLTTLEQARNAAQAQLAEATFLATRFREQMLSKLDGIDRVPLGRLLTGIEAGKSFQTTDRLAIDSELGVLKVSAVSWGQFQPQEAKAIEGNYLPQDHHRVYKGDLLISRANTVDLVGAVVRIDQNYPNRLLSDKTLRLLIDETQVLPDFLLHILRMPEARKHIEANATGTSDSMRNISQETIRSIPVVLPGIEVQRKIAEQMEQVDTALNELSQAVKVQLRDINLLPAKILTKAFDSL